MGHDLVSLRLAGSGEPLFARVRPPVRDTPHRHSTVATTASACKAPVCEADVTERRRIVNALTTAKWRPIEAAKLLGMSRATLYRRIARHKIVPPHRR
jgi:transcriptional regulator of acetoin/glycerol metabolism